MGSSNSKKNNNAIENTDYIKMLEENNYRYQTLLNEKKKELLKIEQEKYNYKFNIEELNKKILILKNKEINEIKYNSLYKKYKSSILVIIDTLAKQCNLNVEIKGESDIILNDHNNNYNDFNSIKEYLGKFSGSLKHKKLLLFLEIFKDL
jgi:hypothetical protein